MSDASTYKKLFGLFESVNLFLDIYFKLVGHSDPLSSHVEGYPIFYYYLVSFIDSLFYL